MKLLFVLLKRNLKSQTRPTTHPDMHSIANYLKQLFWKKENYEFIFGDDWKIGNLSNPSCLLQLTHSDTRFDVNYLKNSSSNIGNL